MAHERRVSSVGTMTSPPLEIAEFTGTRSSASLPSTASAVSFSK